MFLWFIEGWLIITTIAYAIHCFKDKNKIEIMSVDKVLKEIKRKEESDKKSLF
jgi:hypothetical protein